MLAVVMHHIVADGWSFRILFDELAADYAATVRGGKPVTPEPPFSTPTSRSGSWSMLRTAGTRRTPDSGAPSWPMRRGAAAPGRPSRTGAPDVRGQVHRHEATPA